MGYKIPQIMQVSRLIGSNYAIHVSASLVPSWQSQNHWMHLHTTRHNTLHSNICAIYKFGVIRSTSNKIMLMHTQSLSNAVCFKHDNNVRLRMRSKCINFTSGRKSVTGNEFSNINFLYDVEILAAQRCFSLILAIFHCTCAASTIV